MSVIRGKKKNIADAIPRGYKSKRGRAYLFRAIDSRLGRSAIYKYPRKARVHVARVSMRPTPRNPLFPRCTGICNVKITSLSLSTFRLSSFFASRLGHFNSANVSEYANEHVAIGLCRIISSRFEISKEIYKSIVLNCPR